MSERRFTIDHSADAAYFPIAPMISPGEPAENVVIERTHGSIILDFDVDGQLLGVEVIGAATLLTPQTIEDAEVLAQ